ncbi:MAG: helix-turn-helix domain-containing protein [Bacteroidales bacterium]|jgi:hypothetical protein
MKKSKLFGIRAASEYLGIPVPTLKDHIYKQKDIFPERIGNSLVFTKSELDRFCSEPRRKAGRPKKYKV